MFQVDGDKIQNLLFCDNSDTEDTLQLDEENLGFLENDVDHIAHNVHTADLEPLDVVIEPPIQYSTSSSSAASDLQINEQNLYVNAKLSEEIKYWWKKIDPVSEVSSTILNNNIEFEYGQILLPLEKTATPFKIFKKVSKFDQFLIEIVIPQTILYSQQQGHVFEVELDEMKAFFVNCLSAYPLQTIKRRKKGSKESDTVVCPLLVKSYNEYSYMGGVDFMDQKKVTYQFSRKSHHKYYLRIVYDLIDISINNAYVVYEKLNKGNKEKLDLKSYKMQLIDRSLFEIFTNRKRSFSAAPIETAKILKAIQSHSQVVHPTIVKATKRQRCKLCTKNKTSNLTFNKCIECNIHLCFVISRNCFQTYHDSL